MILESEDIKQETALYRLMGRDSSVPFVKQDMLRNKRYQYSWGNKFEHIHLECLESDLFPISLIVNDNSNLVLYNEALSFLSERNAKILDLWCSGFRKTEIAPMFHLTRSMICKIVGQSIKIIRERWGIEVF